MIVDIDGTLAHHHGVRNIFEWGKVNLDKPDTLVVEVVRGLRAQNIRIVVTSGRDDICKPQTWVWLREHLGFDPADLLMRVTGDTRRDCIVKKEILFNQIAPKYAVIGAIDDRPQVVMGCWLPLGIQVLMAGRRNPYIWF